jgi:pantoate--beta-alanine ligase
VDTVREADGLALSSRNRYLSADARVRAPALYAALCATRAAVAAGERDPARVKALFQAELAAEPAFRLQYFELCDPLTMRPVAATLPGATLAVVAAYLGETRLIDNLVI